MSTSKTTTKKTLNRFLKQFEGDSFFYGNAAHAFYDVMVWLQKNRALEKPNIVMPVYIPAKLYRFILAAGYEPKFYDVSTDLDFDLDEINNLIDDQTQAVFAVHFFGIPVDLHPLKKITSQKGVFLIEDCAHCMNGEYSGTALGSLGDCTLFSTRKMMQFHCGGVLVLNTQPWEFKPSETKRVRSIFTAYHLIGSRLKFLANNYLKRFSPFQNLLVPYEGYVIETENHEVTVKLMDRFTKWYSNLLDLDKLVEQRRENLLVLLNGIKDHPFIKPIGLSRYSKVNEAKEYSLNKGFTPFSLPVLIPSHKRNHVQQLLFDAGVACFIGWPEAPFGKTGFAQAETLQTGLLELPVHKYVSVSQLQTMVDCINKISP